MRRASCRSSAATEVGGDSPMVVHRYIRNGEEEGYRLRWEDRKVDTFSICGIRENFLSGRKSLGLRGRERCCRGL